MYIRATWGFQYVSWIRYIIATFEFQCGLLVSLQYIEDHHKNNQEQEKPNFFANVIVIWVKFLCEDKRLKGIGVEAHVFGHLKGYKSLWQLLYPAVLVTFWD